MPIQAVCVGTDTIKLPVKMNLSSSKTLCGGMNLCVLSVNIAEEVHVNEFGHSRKNAKECFGLYQKRGVFATLLTFQTSSQRVFISHMRGRQGKTCLFKLQHFIDGLKLGEIF